jgi:hypothetical protein
VAAAAAAAAILEAAAATNTPKAPSAFPALSPGAFSLTARVLRASAGFDKLNRQKSTSSWWVHQEVSTSAWMVTVSVATA